MDSLMKECEKHLKYYGLGKWFFRMDSQYDSSDVTMTLVYRFNPNEVDAKNVVIEMTRGIAESAFVKSITDKYQAKIDVLKAQNADLEKYRMFYEMSKEMRGVK